MAFKRERFTFIQHEVDENVPEVIALAPYKGKIYKGYAKCDPRDKFDIEVGKELASRRCNVKIATRRLKNAQTRYDNAMKQVQLATLELERALSHLTNSEKEYEEAYNLIDDITKNLSE